MEKSLRAQTNRFRPDAKASPEEIERRREYYSRPEVKERYKARAKTEEYREYQRAYRASAKAKQMAAERNRLRYHFPIGLFDQLMEAQGRACAICRAAFDSSPRSIHSDHCHIGNMPRGLLCRHCNTLEGHLRKIGLAPEEFAARLAAYLADPPAKRLVEDAGGESHS